MKTASIYHTKDGGVIWAEQFSGRFLLLNAVSFVNEKIGWAIGARGVVVNTTDGGQTWVRKYLPENVTFLDVIFTDSRGVGGRWAMKGKFCARRTVEPTGRLTAPVHMKL